MKTDEKDGERGSKGGYPLTNNPPKRELTKKARKLCIP